MNNACSGVQPEGLGRNQLTLASVSSQAHINQTSIPHMAGIINTNRSPTQPATDVRWSRASPPSLTASSPDTDA